MWGAFLSEPLTIAGQVGRYPACCLMVRIPIRVPNVYLRRHAEAQDHRVLIHVSMGYPRDTGRLDTRYAPIRRSTSRESKLSLPFPLDLHVLSL